MFCWSSAYFGPEIETFSNMFTCISSSSGDASFKLARLRVSASTCFLPRRYSIDHSHLLSASLPAILMVLLPWACAVSFRGVCGQSGPELFFPRMYSLNFRVLKTIASISFSIGAQLSSDA